MLKYEYTTIPTATNPHRINRMFTNRCVFLLTLVELRPLIMIKIKINIST